MKSTQINNDQYLIQRTHNPLVRSSTLRGGTNKINGLKHYEAELFSAFLFCVPVPRPRL